MNKYSLSGIAAGIAGLLMFRSNSFSNKKSSTDKRLSPDSTLSDSRNVVINGERLSDEEVKNLEKTCNIKVFDGIYWYDTICGAWGIEGGPCTGMGKPGLKLGGALKADASNGNTGVFVNGRQLHIIDVMGLQLLFGAVWPGRFWVDAHGNFGYEGLPMMGNLNDMAQRAGTNADKTVYGKFGSLSEVGFFGNTTGGQDPYFR